MALSEAQAKQLVALLAAYQAPDVGPTANNSHGWSQPYSLDSESAQEGVKVSDDLLGYRGDSYPLLTKSFASGIDNYNRHKGDLENYFNQGKFDNHLGSLLGSMARPYSPDFGVYLDPELTQPDPEISPELLREIDDLGKYMYVPKNDFSSAVVNKLGATPKATLKGYQRNRASVSEGQPTINPGPFYVLPRNVIPEGLPPAPNDQMDSRWWENYQPELSFNPIATPAIAAEGQKENLGQHIARNIGTGVQELGSVPERLLQGATTAVNKGPGGLANDLLKAFDGAFEQPAKNRKQAVKDYKRNQEEYQKRPKTDPGELIINALGSLFNKATKR